MAESATSFHFRGLLAAWLVLLSWTALGCEETVDPVLETDEVFSLYGFLNPSSERQAIRVFSIDGTLEHTRPEPMYAVVRTRNHASGEEVVWRDSIVTYDNRTVGHVFYADFRADHGTRYTLSATRSDGRETTVSIETPPDGIVAIDTIFSARSSVIVDLIWSNVPRVIQAEASYVVRVPFPDGSDTTTVQVNIQSGRVEQNSDDTWRVSILPSADIAAVFSALQIQPGVTPVYLDKIIVSAFVTSSDWTSAAGVSDPELLVQPGTFSNVENGFGFVGGGYFDRFELKLDDSAARNAGFSVD